MGLEGSGVDLVGDVIRALGLPSVDSVAPGPLSDFNDRLLERAGGDRSQFPAIGPREAARLLSPLHDEARDLFATVFGSPKAAGDGPSIPWVWADPTLSLLATFWRDALEISPAAGLVHRHPTGLGPRPGQDPGAAGAADVVAEWDRYNRAAMAQCFEWPAAVLRHERLLEQTKAQVQLVVEFLAICQVAPLDGGIE